MDQRKSSAEHLSPNIMMDLVQITEYNLLTGYISLTISCFIISFLHKLLVVTVV